MTSSLTAIYAPYPWQVPVWRDQSPVMLLTGSAGGGKSKIAAEKIHGFMLAYPGACGVVLRKAREWCTGSVVPMLEEAIGEDRTVHIKKSDSIIEYDNGSRIYWGGMKDKEQREAIRSKRGKYGDPDIAWMEEANAFTFDDYQEFSARLRGNVADWTQLILSTNPDYPEHWIYKQLILGQGASIYYSNAHDNPLNTKSYFARLDALTGVLRDRLRDGKWVRAEGVVYDEYDPATHLIEPFEIPREWRRFRCIDFGYTNPFVCQWWVVDNDGKMFRYREIYMSKRTVEEHAQQIKTLSGDEQIETTVCDHDAEDRATLSKHGIPNIAAYKDVTVGIQRLQKRLKENSIFYFRGALVEEDISLVDARKPICTEQEFPGYAWQRTQDGKPLKEVPVKINDHGMDDSRYAVMYIDPVTGNTSEFGDDPFGDYRG